MAVLYENFNDKKFIRMEVIRLAQRGRKPKPTAVKQLEGNPGKRQLNANEPKPAARAPSCPKWLEDDAKRNGGVLRNRWNSSVF